MSNSKDSYTGKWLHSGDRKGKAFSHEHAEYDHDESPGASGVTRMRHAVVEQEGQQVGVWVPADWTDEQVEEAMATDW
ncbi:hypothetical protein [Devosia pacifica]|nr:hypothetical protein [Devosia pacifica]